MCGLFGIVGNSPFPYSDLAVLAKHAEQRGTDSSGLYISSENKYDIYRADLPITSLLKNIGPFVSSFAMGHSRLVTNGLVDNQPIYRDSVCAVHNGIVVNHSQLWGVALKQPYQEIDTEVLPALADYFLSQGSAIDTIAHKILNLCEGVVSCALAFPRLGKLVLFSNNGSLYHGRKNNAHYFASELYPLSTLLKCQDVKQICQGSLVLDIPVNNDEPTCKQFAQRKVNLLPKLGTHKSQEKALKYHPYRGQRCTRCILPATMPFIDFDASGVCNYCRNYRIRNHPKPVSELESLLLPYRRPYDTDCIIPFSGGRDSCYALHLVAQELKMNPITYTYDWGMVTDLGRRNVSRICAKLGIENIIIAADIGRKRRHIARNFGAWLKSPHLGMVSILTAGDKHFFRHVETVKRQTGLSLNLWGVNPLEVTYFKAGFLGIPPDFAENRVYSHGVLKQLRYQTLRLGAMLKSPGYFNDSLGDTLTGEYYRSFRKKIDYFHLFDYYRWDENEINNTLINEYGWETAPDTNTTWRIGDGTAAMYNYIFSTVAGFTEHDTFRSNQIREGDLSREQALALVEDENRPRYPNIKWYLDAISMEFDEVISIINKIPPLYDY